MSTGYLWNGFGNYEVNEKGEKGMTLSYAGVEFWLPFEKVTPIPNYNFRELDHDKSTAALGEVATLVYQTVRVPGERIVEELTMTQQPFRNYDLGIIPLKGTKRTGNMVTVCDGREVESGKKTFTEVPEVEATKAEKEEAAALALQFKKMQVQEYLQSKRDKMMGGQGRSFPDARIRAYMDELGIEDVDDVTAHSKNNGLTPELVKILLKEVNAAGAEAHAEALAQAVKDLRSEVRAEKTAAAQMRKEQ